MAIDYTGNHGKPSGPRRGRRPVALELSKAAFDASKHAAENGLVWGAMSLAICLRFMEGAKKGYIASVKENFGPNAYEEVPASESGSSRELDPPGQLLTLTQNALWHLEGAANVAIDSVVAGRQSATKFKKTFTPNENKLRVSGNRAMYIACAIAAVWCMRGHWMGKNPYLDLPLTASLDNTTTNPFDMRRSTDPTVADVSKFKGIPAVLLVCTDPAQFDIVVEDFMRRVERGGNICDVTPPKERVETSHGVEMRDPYDKVYIAKKHNPDSDLKQDVYYIVVNGEKCKLGYVNDVTKHLGLPDKFKAYGIRGHNYTMVTSTEEFLKRGLLEEHCLAFWGGCQSDQDVPLVARPNMPVVSTGETGYAGSNNSNMFSIVSALNQRSTASWSSVAGLARRENPISSSHFVFPGTSTYSSLFHDPAGL